MDKKKIKEFFADKKNRRFVGLSALTFLGLIGALALQTVWLYNTFMFEPLRKTHSYDCKNYRLELKYKVEVKMTEAEIFLSSPICKNHWMN